MRDSYWGRLGWSAVCLGAVPSIGPGSGLSAVYITDAPSHHTKLAKVTRNPYGDPTAKLRRAGSRVKVLGEAGGLFRVEGQVSGGALYRERGLPSGDE